MVDWNVIAGEVMTQVLRVIVPVFIAMIIKWGIELYHKIRTEQPDWTPVLEYAAEMAVLAAEQIFGDGQGAEKKAYAIQVIQDILAEKGIPLNISVIEDAIEAEVYKWLHHEDEPKPETANADDIN